MKRLRIPQNLGYEKLYVHEIAAVVYQKFTSWKTQGKYVNQTTAILIAIELRKGK